MVSYTEKKVYRIEINRKRDPVCHLKVLDQCLNKAYYFTHRSNTTDFSADAKEFDKMCSAVVKVINCMDKYFEKCSYPVRKEIYEIGKDQFYQSWRQMCTEGPIRDSMALHFCYIFFDIFLFFHFKRLLKAFAVYSGSD